MGVRNSITVIEDVFRSGFDLHELEWTSWVEPGREGVEFHLLWAPEPTDGTQPTDGSIGLLLRFQPGAHGDLHRHLGRELMLVLDGVLRNDDGVEYRPGALIVEEPDSIHQMSSRTGCTVLAIRTQPARAVEQPTPAN